MPLLLSNVMVRPVTIPHEVLRPVQQPQTDRAGDDEDQVRCQGRERSDW